MHVCVGWCVKWNSLWRYTTLPSYNFIEWMISMIVTVRLWRHSNIVRIRPDLYMLRTNFGRQMKKHCGVKNWIIFHLQSRSKNDMFLGFGPKTVRIFNKVWIILHSFLCLLNSNSSNFFLFLFQDFSAERNNKKFCVSFVFGKTKTFTKNCHRTEARVIKKLIHGCMSVSYDSVL
jgi:hypothetical protein